MRRPRLLVPILLAGVLAAGAGVSASAAATAPAGRLGLHVTAAELEEWRIRAASGPYRSAGDVSQHSPGDWDRISSRAATFMANPAANRWAGPSDSSGCVDGVTSTTYDPKDVHSRHLRDAAFRSLVQNDAHMRAAAAAELVAQSQVANLDFSDRDRWCLGTIWDLNPGFEVANFLTSLLYALEYIEIGDRAAGTTSFAAGQREAVLDWMAAAAEWMNHDNEVKLDSNFTDRQALPEPPYTLTTTRSDTPAINAAPYDGTGDVIGAVARFYNNRRAQQQRFVGLLGLHLLHRADGYRPAVGALGTTAEEFVSDSDRFARDYLVYSVYPAGFTGEFHRWKSTLPDLGWSYAVGAAAPVLTYIDAAARAGDRSLYGYSTTAGVHNTAGAPAGEVGKNYRWLVSQTLGYQDATHLRHIPGYAGQDAYRIDAVNAATSWYAVHEAAFAPTLRYWADDYHQTVIDRTAPGTSAYPSQPAGFGQYSAWTGDWGTLPGALFMTSRMQHVASPYDTATTAPTTEPIEEEQTTTEPVVEEPVVATAVVRTVTATGEGGKNRNNNLVATTQLVDGAGVPLPGATVVLTATRNGARYGSVSVTTSSEGIGTTKWTKVARGTYEVTVTSVVAGTAVWDGTSPVATWTK